MNTSEIHGHCDQRFQAVEDRFRRNFDEGLELGSSFALSIDGEMLIDLWAGDASADHTRPWVEDTIVPVSSSSKIIVSLCGLMLIDRGLIELDEPVATYWPEFAANGKEALPVRYLFCHAAGLPGLDEMPDWKVWSDYDEVIRRLADQKPWWTPGEQSGYHALTFGHLIGELVRRTTGKKIDKFFRTEVADILDIDFHLGLAESETHRLAEVVHADEEVPDIDPNTYYYRAMGYMNLDDAPDVWTLDMPAGNGVGNARSLVRVGSLLAMGGLADGKRFLTDETASLIWQEQIYKKDLIFWAPVRYGLGFGLASNEFPLPWPNAFHWGGRGGSSMIMVPELKAAFAYTPSRFYQGRGTMDLRGTPLRDAVIGCLA